MKKTGMMRMIAACAAVLLGVTGFPAAGAASLETTDAAQYTYTLTREPQYGWASTDDGTVSLASNSYEYLRVTDEDGADDSARYPGVSSALSVVNSETEALSANFTENVKADALAQYNGYSDKSSFVRYQEENRLRVIRGDSKCLSVLRSDYRYLGGAHGGTSTSGYSFDPETGARLTIADVMNVSGNGELAEVLAAEVPKQNDPNGIGFGGDYDLTASIRGYLDGDGSYSGSNDLHYVTWYVGRGGITFIFDTYLLGPYSSGSFTVTVSKADYPDLVKDDYIYGPAESVEELFPYTSYEVDGKTLSVTCAADEYGTISDVTLIYGGESVQIASYGYDLTLYLISTANGKYLYAEVLEDNDWTVLSAVNLGAQPLTCVNTSLGFGQWVPEDPENLHLSARTYLMSTVGIGRRYHVGADGAPEPNEPYYTVEDRNFWLTLKMDAALSVLDTPDGDAVHTENFAAGSRMRLFRTDDESIMDCLTEDGRYVRFTVDTGSYPQVLNGQYSLEDLFDGTVFAG